MASVHYTSLFSPNSNGKLYIIHRGRFCKKVLRLPPITVNGAVEYGLGRDSARGKLFCRIAKFWYTILQMKQELLEMLL
jgi:uncharacterized protein YbaR (Trm112 family)